MAFNQNILSFLRAEKDFRDKEKEKDKLGQRQSQTPFSSAFWVLTKFGQKKFRVKQIFGPRKFLFGPTKLWVKKNFGPKKIWVKQIFDLTDLT